MPNIPYKLPFGFTELITPESVLAAAQRGASDRAELAKLVTMARQTIYEANAAKGTPKFAVWYKVYWTLRDSIAESERLIRAQEGVSAQRGPMPATEAPLPLASPSGTLPPVAPPIYAAPPPVAPLVPSPAAPPVPPEILARAGGVLPASYEYPPGGMSVMGLGPRDFIRSPIGPLAISRPSYSLREFTSDVPSPQTGFAEKLLALLSLAGKQRAAPETPTPGAMPSDVGAYVAATQLPTTPGMPFIRPTLTRPSTPGVAMESPEYGRASGSENMQAYAATGPMPQSTGSVMDLLRRLFGGR